jgi:hypothetical protein
MVPDVPVAESSSSDGDGPDGVDLENPQQTGLGVLDISQLLQMILQDAQTRLFFKAQSVIQSEIRYYVPKSEDLESPDTWFPTLQKTVWVLSQLHDVVNVCILTLYFEHLPSTVTMKAYNIRRYRPRSSQPMSAVISGGLRYNQAE